MRAVAVSLIAAVVAAAASGGATAAKLGLRAGLTEEPADEATTTPTPSPKPIGEDPYAALGIRAGGFILYPALAIDGGYTSNAGATAGGAGSGFGTLAPELVIQSDWDRHELTITAKGAYEHFFDGSTPDDPSGSADASGRIDFSDGWTADLDAGVAYKHEDIDDPAFPAGADTIPGVVDLNSSAALNGEFGRATFTIAGSADRTLYENATSGGVPVDQSDRINSVFGGRLRLGFEATPSLTPFVEAEVSRRAFDQAVDHNGLQRSGYGVTGRVGVVIDHGPLLTGEVSVGTTRENFDDPTLTPLQALTFDGNLVWAPTALTTITFDASTAINPSDDPASSGSVEYDGSVDVAYAWRPNVTVNGTVSVTDETFQGLGRTDRTYDAGFGATWKLNRTLWLTAGYTHEWLASTDATTDYQSDTVKLELRAQR